MPGREISDSARNYLIGLLSLLLLAGAIGGLHASGVYDARRWEPSHAGLTLLGLLIGASAGGAILCVMQLPRFGVTCAPPQQMIPFGIPMRECVNCRTQWADSATACARCGGALGAPTRGDSIAARMAKLAIPAICAVAGGIYLLKPLADKMTQLGIGGTVTNSSHQPAAETNDTIRIRAANAFHNEGFGKIKGIAVCTASNRLSYAQIVFDLFDAHGNRVGNAMANINGLRPGETWSFEAVALVEFDTFRLGEATGF